MIKLNGKSIYLATLEKEHCKTIYEETEYDFSQVTEPLNIGLSSQKSDVWFEEIQRLQGNVHIRLGIFLPDDTVIGDIALQDIDWKNRSCGLGISITKLEYRCKGYATDAAKAIIDFGFNNIGFERIYSSTLEHNIGSQKVLEKCGFTLEGRERKARYFAGKRYDRLIYGLLKDEYKKDIIDNNNLSLFFNNKLNGL